MELPARSVRDPSLASGNAGLALAHAALHPLFPRRGHLDRAYDALDRAIDQMARTPMTPYLYSGFTGVAWVEEHLRGDPRDDANEAIDDALLGYLATPRNDSFDLIRGLSGIAVYALERLPRASARRILELVVERLDDMARKRRPGVAWWSDPEWLPPSLRETPHPAWNLGVGHGVPGVIPALAGALEAGISSRTTRRLLDGAVTWLLAQEMRARTDAGFARAVGPGIVPEPTRSAWCYGDPGVAATLLAAATSASKPAWRYHAVRIALRASARPVKECRVMDAGLCHGAAGLGHLYHRMYRTTGEPRFARAARAWFVRALSFRRASNGIDQFPSWNIDAKGRETWDRDGGWLTGAAGVALAFATALGADPSWDRLMLLSLRSAEQEARDAAPARQDVRRERHPGARRP